MLKQRIITALLMLAILLPAVFYPSPIPFGLVALVLLAAGAWEWARMNQTAFVPAVLYGGLCALLCAGTWQAGWMQAPIPTLWLVVGSAWVLVALALVRAGVGAWVKVPRVLRLAGGLVVLWAAWLAVAQARTTTPAAPGWRAGRPAPCRAGPPPRPPAPAAATSGAAPARA